MNIISGFSANGVGLRDNFEDKKKHALGMNLIIGLTDQVDGAITINNDNGLSIKITFTRDTNFEVSTENAAFI